MLRDEWRRKVLVAGDDINNHLCCIFSMLCFSLGGRKGRYEGAKWKRMMDYDLRWDGRKGRVMASDCINSHYTHQTNTIPMLKLGKCSVIHKCLSISLLVSFSAGLNASKQSTLKERFHLYTFMLLYTCDSQFRHQRYIVGPSFNWRSPDVLVKCSWGLLLYDWCPSSMWSGTTEEQNRNVLSPKVIILLTLWFQLHHYLNSNKLNNSKEFISRDMIGSIPLMNWYIQSREFLFKNCAGALWEIWLTCLLFSHIWPPMVRFRFINGGCSYHQILMLKAVTMLASQHIGLIWTIYI